MSFLVIGGNGFIGTYLVRALHGQGMRVRVLDRHPQRFLTPLPGVEYIQTDLQDPSALDKALNGVNIVYHLAHAQPSKRDNAAEELELNVVPTLKLLDACVRNRVERVIYLSSGGSIYGNPEVLPVTEDTPAKPIWSYGLVKLTIENCLGFYQRAHGLEYTALRPGNVYGPGHETSRRHGVVDAFLTAVAQGRPVEIWGTGDEMRDFLYVEDAVEALRLAGQKAPASRILNIGSGEPQSVNQVLETVERVTEIMPQRKKLERPKHIPEKIFMDVTRARHELGWSASTTLEEGVRKFWEQLKPKFAPRSPSSPK